MNNAQAVTFAEYNKWMNEKLYDICSQIPATELKKDRGAFFKSIHGTLNHIMLGDKVWFGRFTEAPFKAEAFDQILHEDFPGLRKERKDLDDRILAWAGALSSEELNSEFNYQSLAGPEPRSCPLWVAVTHFFNHQTHHRGQITTLLCQSGLDIGATDLIALPGLVTTSAPQ